ncbi:MAG TPA: C45 family peptidase [Pirellulales bacterium]|nr:C45 family peptidase [Pirellulales bacterium]
MPSTRYREIVVAGSPREMGQQLGEAARDEIRGFAEVALERVNKTVRISRERAMSIAARSTEFARSYSQQMLEELHGMAEGSRVPFDELMLLQVRNQLRPDADAGCTSISLAPTAMATTGPIVAQNWDNDPALDPFTIMLTRKPSGKPALVNLTQAGLIAYIGFNDAGIGLCLNTLPAPSRNVGVPHYFTVRGIYESRSLAGAIDAVRRAERAVPANIMLATPQGPADLEVTLDEVRVLYGEQGQVTHANHCKHPELLAINDAFPELIESYPRQRRIDKLLSAAGVPFSLEAVKTALKDHEGHPRSICRHPNDDPQTGDWQTDFSVIIEPDQQRMHVSRGTPCDHPYETYELL